MCCWEKPGNRGFRFGQVRFEIILHSVKMSTRRLGLDTPLGGISVHVVLIVTGMSEIIRRASTKRREQRKGTED